MACICHFILSFSEPPIGISGVGLFPVQSRVSLIFSSSFRSRKLALNRINHLHLGVVGAFCLVVQAYWGLFGMSVCPYFYPYTFASICFLYICPLVHLYSCMSPICPWTSWGSSICWSGIQMSVQLIVHTSISCL